MIAHHEGGIEMAEAVLTAHGQPHGGIHGARRGQGQQSEIDYMRDLLAERG